MGNYYIFSGSSNINQTQLSTTNQSCGEVAKSTISDVTVSIIDSHVGDIEVSNSLTIGNMDCVMNSVSTSKISDSVKQTSDNLQKALAFQLSSNKSNVTEDINLWSLQESITNQSCTQTVEAVTDNIVFTIIDSTTGNIRLSSGATVQSFNCNLTSATYQEAVANLSQTSKNDQSVSCCGFDLGMILPIIMGIVALVIVTKIVPSKSGGGAGAGSGDTILQDAVATSLLSQTLSSSRNPPTMRSALNPPPQAPAATEMRSISRVNQPARMR